MPSPPQEPDRSPPRFSVGPDDLASPSIRALVREHLEGMTAHSPPGHVFALGLAGLEDRSIRIFSARVGEERVGMLALRDPGDGAGELKSMRTRQDHLRRGVGSTLLDLVVSEARRLGFARLVLETGTGPEFAPALALYARAGFRDAGPFGDYVQSAFNRFLELEL